MNAPESRQLVVAQQSDSFDLSPRNFEQALKFSEYLADSDFVPKDFKGKPGNCLIGIQWGAELGLKPLQALQNIAVINGRPALWGDSVVALVRSSPLCEYIVETDDGETATCRVKRRGEPEQSRAFSMQDAQAAGLKGKQGPWTQYPKRMRQVRARAFALRDVFPDVLRGLPIAEEVMDTPTERHMGPVEEVKPPSPPALPAYPPEDFAKNLPAWGKVVASGKKTGSTLLAMLQTKATFTEQQKAQILSLKTAAAEATPAAPAPHTEAQESAAPAPIVGQNDDWLAGYDAAEEGDK